MKKILILLLFCSTTAFAQKKSSAGIVYKQHPNINTMKKLVALYAAGNANAMAKYYADTIHFYGMTRYDTASAARHSVIAGKTLAEAKAGWQQVIDNWTNIKMVPDSLEGIKYPGRPFTVHSKWTLTMVNKKTKKSAVVKMEFYNQFDKAGKIIVQKEFYDPAPLLAAMK